jgi:hypothetical protein
VDRSLPRLNLDGIPSSGAPVSFVTSVTRLMNGSSRGASKRRVKAMATGPWTGGVLRRGMRAPYPVLNLDPNEERTRPWLS